MQSGFLLSCNGTYLLFAPYLSDSLTVKYAQTDKRHVRLSERVIDLVWPTGLTADQQARVGDVLLHGVPAAHNELAVDQQGRNLYMGFVAELGPYRVYHSGDTFWYDGIVETRAPFQVDLALLPINGNQPERRVAGNLNPDEAALLGRRIGAKLTEPQHYELFAFDAADPADFVAACQCEQTPYRVMSLGEQLTM